MTIDTVEYQKGVAAFAGGMTLLSLFMLLANHGGVSKEQEERDLSFALGFADGLLKKVRSLR